MGREEQIEEREVLDSIFPEEISDIDEHSFRVSIALDPTAQDAEEKIAPPAMILTVVYPETYPDIAPTLTISAPPNATKYPYLEISDDRASLLELLEPTIEENLGMAMVYTLVSTLKELAEQLIAERQAAQQKVRELEAQKAEEEENAKFHGTAVTRETFLEWRQKFDKEMKEEEDRRRLEQEAEDKKRKIKTEDRLTGRQLWERGLVKGEEDEDGEEGVTGSLQELKLEASTIRKPGTEKGSKESSSATLVPPDS